MRILYIDIDSCRADHLGCYGYGRPTSPIIDELAAGGTVLADCYASDTPCLPSRAALFSGRFGISNGVTCHDGPASQLRYPRSGRGHGHDPSRPMWMRYFQEKGWQTVCFSGFMQRHQAWWFAAGFTQHFGNQLPGGPEPADEVNQKVVPWLRRNGAEDDWFLHVNYWDVHTPYHAPDRHWDRFASEEPPTYPDRETISDHVANYYGPRTARDWWIEGGWQNPNTGQTAKMPAGNPDNWENYLGFLNGYDAGIAYVDEKVGELLEELDRLGVREETAVIVSSDHGESIAELGMYFEHGNCTEGTTRVPLVMSWPGLTEARGSLGGLTYQLDLPPTVLELLGMEVPEGWHGQSFAGALEAERRDWSPREHLVLGTGIYSFQRAVRTGRYRLIRTIHPGLLPYDNLYLFDTQEDPHQTTNIAEEHPDIVAELDHTLLEFLYHHTSGALSQRDPFQEQLRAGIDPDLYCPRDLIEERLVRLGREDQLADLKFRRGLL